MSKRHLSLFSACVGTSIGAVAALGTVVSSSPHTWGPDRPYAQVSPPVGFHINSFFDVFTELSLDGSSNFHMPPPIGASSGFSSGGSGAMRISLNGLPPGVPVEGLYAVSFFDVFADLSVDPGTGDQIRTFNTEMLQLDLAGGDATGSYMLRESPTKVSTGKTQIRESPTLGVFHIDSFFDVFTELSIDGGQTWIPADGALRIEVMPTPGAAALLGLGGLVAGRRRR